MGGGLCGVGDALCGVDNVLCAVDDVLCDFGICLTGVEDGLCDRVVSTPPRIARVEANEKSLPDAIG